MEMFNANVLPVKRTYKRIRKEGNSNPIAGNHSCMQTPAEYMVVKQKYKTENLTSNATEFLTDTFLDDNNVEYDRSEVKVPDEPVNIESIEPNNLMKVRNMNTKQSVIPRSSNYDTIVVEDENDMDSSTCYFCGKSFAWEWMTCLKLEVPLPSSFMDTISLLRQFGIIFPVTSTTENKSNVPKNVCQKCYDVIFDSDVAYQQIINIKKCMMEMWSKQAVVEDLCATFIQSKHQTQFLKKHGNASGSQEIHFNYQISDPNELELLQRSKIPEADEIDVNFEDGKAFNSQYKNCLKKCRRKPLTCFLCGKDFFIQDAWVDHLDHHHRIQKKWQKFTSHMHYKLKTNLSCEVMSKCGIRTCCACDQRFNGKEEFVNHLHKYHNMIIDQHLFSYISEENMVECHDHYQDNEENLAQSGNKRINKKKVSFTENESVEDQRIIYSDIGFGVNRIDTSENVIADNGTLVRVETTNTSMDVCERDSQDEMNTGKKDDEKEERILRSDYRVTCNLCHCTFENVFHLDDHILDEHTSSIIMKGDGRGEAVGYSNDIVDANESINHTVETSASAEQFVQLTQELNALDDKVSKTSVMANNNDKNESANKNPSLDTALYTVYECNICCRRMVRKGSLINHVRKFHCLSHNLEQQVVKKCKFCLFQSTDLGILKEHVKQEHSKQMRKPRVPCGTCGKLYVTTSIQGHIDKVHNKGRKNLSEFHGTKCQDNSCIQSHICLDRANKEWKCTECLLKFKEYHQLRQHNIIYHKIRYYSCGKCPKTFKKRKNLTLHMRYCCAKDVNYDCNYCSKKYKYFGKLRAHLIKFHGVSEEEISSEQCLKHKRAKNSFKKKGNSKVFHRKQGRIKKKIAVKALIIGKESEMQESHAQSKSENIEIVKNNFVRSLQGRTGPIVSNKKKFEFVEVIENSNMDMEVDDLAYIVLQNPLS